MQYNWLEINDYTPTNSRKSTFRITVHSYLVKVHRIYFFTVSYKHMSRDQEISNNVVCATSKGSDQPAHTRSLIRAFAHCLNILRLKLLTEQPLEFLSLKGGCILGCIGLSEPIHVKMPHYWKFHVLAHLVHK